MAALGAGRETLEITSLQARMRSLEQKLADALTERDLNLREISKLQDELKKQEEHYTKEV
jgi:hypothetical protein